MSALLISNLSSLPESHHSPSSSLPSSSSFPLKRRLSRSLFTNRKRSSSLSEPAVHLWTEDQGKPTHPVLSPKRLSVLPEDPAVPRHYDHYHSKSNKQAKSSRLSLQLRRASLVIPMSYSSTLSPWRASAKLNSPHSVYSTVSDQFKFDYDTDLAMKAGTSPPGKPAPYVPMELSSRAIPHPRRQPLSSPRDRTIHGPVSAPAPIPVRPTSHYIAPQLPPGAAEPTLGRINWNTYSNFNSFASHSYNPSSSSSVDILHAPMQAKTHAHVRSCSQPSSISGHGKGKQQDMISPSSYSSPPAVPPRSQLRAQGSTPSSVMNSNSSSTTTSPLPSRNSSLASRATSDMSLPSLSPPSTPRSARQFSPTGHPTEYFGSDHINEAITFGNQRRRPGRTVSEDYKGRERVATGVSSDDPHRIRDGLQARKASSGVYTPSTFRPALGQSRTTPVTSPTTSVSSSMASPHSPAAHSASPRKSHHHGHGVRARTLSGFKRLSVAFNSHDAPPTPPLPEPLPRNSGYYANPSLLPSPSISSTNGAQVIRSSTGQLQAISPRSARSTSSGSPPMTPITPTSDGHSHMRYKSYSPAIATSGDFGPPIDFSAPPARASLNLRNEDPVGIIGKSPTVSEEQRMPPSHSSASQDAARRRLRNAQSMAALPKVSLAPATQPPPLPTQQTSATESASIEAPKRSKRKPVPRLDDDVVRRLEALEVQSQRDRPKSANRVILQTAQLP